MGGWGVGGDQQRVLSQWGSNLVKGESVAHSESTPFRKPSLSRIELGHHMDW